MPHRRRHPLVAIATTLTASTAVLVLGWAAPLVAHSEPNATPVGSPSNSSSELAAPLPSAAAAPTTTPPPSAEAASALSSAAIGPVPSGPPLVPPPTPAPTTDAVVHVYSPTPAWLETRDRLARDAWIRACDAPCDARVPCDGREARIAGPNLSPSNPFVLEPGTGTVRLRVNPGLRRVRRLGVIALTTGLPVTGGGVLIYGRGQQADEPALVATGVTLLAVGGLAVLTAIPVIASGSTRVQNERGRRIATEPAPPRF